MDKKEIREELLKDAAKELRDRGLTPEIAKEVLKLIEDSDLDDEDNVHVRVINIKTSKKRVDDSQEAEKPQDEPNPEAAEEPTPERVASMIQTNIRFAKAMKDATNEFYQLSCLANEILKENQELRARLGEK